MKETINILVVIFAGSTLIWLLGNYAERHKDKPADTQVGTIHYRDGVPSITFAADSLGRINAAYKVYQGHIFLELGPKVEQ